LNSTRKEAPNVTVTATYDSSGTLEKQIEQGAECDLFISAAQKQMNALDGSLKTDTRKIPTVRTTCCRAPGWTFWKTRWPW
jgi:molybdate transport system substrate-binding protein